MPTINELRKRREQSRSERVKLTARLKHLDERLRRLARRIKVARKRRGLPSWLPTRYAEKWRKPWTVSRDPGQDQRFKALIWKHGYASPHFTRKTAGGKLRHPQGCDVPDSLRANCQRHAFGLERVRHDLKDRPMNPGSWYRCPPHNSAVGGASASQHMQANATDWFADERIRLGGGIFDAAMRRHFSGLGYQSTVGGPVRHADDGPARSWVYS
jgi:hypothetical protein